MELREATHSDAAAIARLHANSWRFAYRDVLADGYLKTEADRDRLKHWQDRLNAPAPNQSVFVLDDGARPIGFASVFVGHDPVLGSWLNNLHVAEEHLRLGCGARLMSAVQAHCFRLYPDASVFLWVVASNERAQAFYSRLGASIRGENYWDPPGGGSALLYRMAWDSPADIRVAANNSFKPKPLRGSA